jgi:hypothetical protein
MRYSPSSKTRLTEYDLPRFPGETLFARIARAVCQAGCLPRKELYEAWELARRVRRLCRGGRVLDFAGGHGLLAHVMLILDDSSPDAQVIDTSLPPSSRALHEALTAAWPRLAGRISFTEADMAQAAIGSDAMVVSSHACGALTDAVLERAVSGRAPVAVLPCCHDRAACDPGPLGGWLERSLAVDAMRAVRLEQQGYRVWTQHIRQEVTPKNRLLLGIPRERT